MIKIKNTKIWGLTGGIASGKSTAARFFAEAGIPVIDADQIARQLTKKNGMAYKKILKRFGTTNRKKLREIVFNDAKARRVLERILHPLIKKESSKQIKKIVKSLGKNKQNLYIIYEAALLVETGRYKDFDGLIVVDAPKSIRKKRLIKRDHLAPELVEKIFLAQIDDKQRRLAATYILNNSGNTKQLKKQVQKRIQEIFTN